MGVNKLPDAKDLELLRRRMSTQFQIPSAYDDALSYQGLIYKLIQYLKDTMKNVEDWNEWLEDFAKTIEPELKEQIEIFLNLWKDNGVLQEIVNEVTKGLLKDNVINTAFYGIDDTGEQDSTVQFQKAIDDAISQQLPLKINGKIRIDGTININLGYYAEKKQLIIYGGHLVKETTGYLFSSTLTAVDHQIPAGNVQFMGTVFTSKEGQGTIVFDPWKILRIQFDVCKFIDVDHLFKNDNINAYAQTVYLNSCIIVGGNGYFMEVNNSYDISLTHSRIEHRDSLMNISLHNSTRIVDNLIEGMKGKVLRFNGGRNIELSYNYFEANCTRDIEEPYVEQWHPNAEYAFNFVGNLCLDNAESYGRDVNTYYLIRLKRISNANISKNYTDVNLVSVENESTVKPKNIINFADNLFSNKNTIYYLNKHRFNDGIVGSGNYLPNLQYPIGSYMGHVGANNAPYITEITPNDPASYIGIDSLNRIIITPKSVTTNPIGFDTPIFNVMGGRNYCIGINFNYQSTRNLIRIQIINVNSGLSVYDYVPRPETMGGINGMKYYSLPAHYLAQSGKHKLRILLEKNNGQDFEIDKIVTIENIWVQIGSVAMPSTKPVMLLPEL